MSTWKSDAKSFREVFADILNADEKLFVLVNSQQRSGSKYLQGVLASAFGFRSGLSPEFIGAEKHGVFRQSYPTNPGHTHGLSDARLSELTHMMEKGQSPTDRQQKDEAKADMVSFYRDRVAGAGSLIVFTLIREDADRLISSFVLQKAESLDSASDADIVAEYVKFRRGKSFEDWMQSEMTGVFGVPPVAQGCSDPMILQDGKLRYIVIPIASLDDFLAEYLFSSVSVTSLADRSLDFGLRYGLGRRNSSKARGLDKVSQRVRAVLQRA